MRCFRKWIGDLPACFGLGSIVNQTKNYGRHSLMVGGILSTTLFVWPTAVVAQHPKPSANQPAALRQLGAELPVRVEPTVGEWTPNRVLPDSSKHLNWGKPRRVKMAEMHRSGPSFLKDNVATSSKSASEQPEPQLAPRGNSRQAVRQASYIDLREFQSADLPVETLTGNAPAPLPASRIRRASPLQVEVPAAIVTPTAYQDFPEDDAFGDVTGDLLPSDDETLSSTPESSDDLAFPDLQSGDDAFPADDGFPETELGASEDLASPAADEALDPFDAFDSPTTEDLPRQAEQDATDFESQDGLPDQPFDLSPTPADPSAGDPFDSLADPDVESPSDVEPPRGNEVPSESLPLPDLDGNDAADSAEGADAADLTADDDELDSSGDSDRAKTYNGRDCPAEMQGLRDAWLELRRRPVSEITLDITPMIEPTKTEAEEAAAREENLSLAPSRTWRNRSGSVVAEGHLIDFRNSKVTVRDVSGQNRTLSWYELSNDDLCFVSAWWELPSEFSPESTAYAMRNWTMTTFTWTASALCHKPLYFEEVQLERYGHSAGPVKQAALSGVHFFGNIVFLPYHLGLNPPNECKYALGYYRPGSCAPWLLPAIPLDARAARMQVGALTGGLTLIP